MNAVEITFDGSSKNEFAASISEIVESDFLKYMKLPDTNNNGQHKYYAVVIKRNGNGQGERAISMDMTFTYANGVQRSEIAYISLMKGESQLELVKLVWGMADNSDLKTLEIKHIQYK